MVTSAKSDRKVSILFGKVRHAILSVLFGHTDEAFYLRQLVRTTGFGLGPVQRELKQLTEAGIIRRTVSGRQVYFQANPDSPLFPELRCLFVKISGMSEPLSAAEPYASASLPAGQRFNISGPRLSDFCRRNHIVKLSLFGSVLKDDFLPDSDIDVLVEFEPGHVPGFAIVAMENELSRLAGRKVDLRTPGDLGRHFREGVIREVEVRYARS
jgi:hypothetical protein